MKIIDNKISFQPVHEGENITDGSRTQGRLTGDGALTPVGQRRTHHCQRLAVQLQRAGLRSNRLVTSGITEETT